ncbi:glycosyl transferase family 1 [Longibacter salinarum]|uniref:Glycosyl transferase family 1 n=1 Tax=Longibacter salinarum TaxID=1850348 RepID=A0A2A8CV93_9BACT|nr:glycosyltransferase family 4 protein [Longibacter salinarum]PEN12612.1 glycosyl transferase family 1 [Longibacter salinarum]
MRILALYTDAFGGYGGIAAANRHFLRGLCAYPGVEELVALPLLQPEPITSSLPGCLDHRTEGIGGKSTYLRALTKVLLKDRDFDLVWCGHIHLTPIALVAKALLGAPLLLNIHGVDAWTPTHRRLVNWSVPHIDHVISVADVTKRRFIRWSGVSPQNVDVLPNTIDFSGLTPGPKSDELIDRYNLGDGPVLMTMGRLVGRDRRKGFDRVLEVMPELLNEYPGLTYLIAGKGPDRERLEQKATDLGVRDRVVFAGYVPESEKAEHFRLADAYVMPSEGEGFGLVILEALACGVPAIGSTSDGTSEALQHGRFGSVVDPADQDALMSAIRSTLDANTSVESAAVRSYYGKEAYRERQHALLDKILEPDST